MEFVIGFAILWLVGVLAVLFGHDSRDGYSTKEKDLAEFGMRWEMSMATEPDGVHASTEAQVVEPGIAEELGDMVPAGHDGWPPELARLVGQPGSR